MVVGTRRFPIPPPEVVAEVAAVVTEQVPAAFGALATMCEPVSSRDTVLLPDVVQAPAHVSVAMEAAQAVGTAAAITTWL
jgi:hypothetical protein